MKLGLLEIEHPVFLAPLAGITDYPFRQLAREHGCGLVFTDMVSAEGLLRRGKTLVRLGPGEHPVSVQLFGEQAEALAEAARIAEEAGADAVDLNMGCPARQVTETGAGADLMRHPDKVEKIVTQVRRRIRCPLTVKIRSGWDEDHVNALEIGRLAEDCGADAITLHPRTRAQWLHGRADWSLIGRVKASVRIPVIGNGDVTTPALLRRMREETGCDGVMIGKGSLGNPWIFDPLERWTLQGGSGIAPSLEERRRVIERHYELLKAFYEASKALKEIRRHTVWYTRGLPFCAPFHASLSGLRDEQAFREAVHAFFEQAGRRREGLGQPPAGLKAGGEAEVAHALS
jgi:tRNA-dihydrouridine synthase B